MMFPQLIMFVVDSSPVPGRGRQVDEATVVGPQPHLSDGVGATFGAPGRRTHRLAAPRPRSLQPAAHSDQAAWPVSYTRCSGHVRRQVSNLPQTGSRRRTRCRRRHHRQVATRPGNQPPDRTHPTAVQPTRIASGGTGLSSIRWCRTSLNIVRAWSSACPASRIEYNSYPTPLRLRRADPRRVPRAVDRHQPASTLIAAGQQTGPRQSARVELS
jgi:hypothetical protein